MRLLSRINEDFINSFKNIFILNLYRDYLIKSNLLKSFQHFHRLNSNKNI